MKYKLGWASIILISFGTAFLWGLSKNFTFSAQSMGGALYYLGQLSGLTGFTLFSLALVLNTRWKFLEEAFGGLDRVYLAHHTVGGLALVFLLFHPSLLVVQSLEISPQLAASFFLPGADMITNFGRYALYTLFTLLFLTFYVNLPYHIWKFTHQFLGVAYILAGLHIVFIPSDILIFLPLRIYMLGLLGLGLISYSYRIFLHRFFLTKYYFTVENVNPQSKEITEIVMKPKGKMFDFMPGQFVFIRFMGNKTGVEQHPFSITSKKGENTLRLTIKSLGDFTEHIPEIKEGSEAIVEGPYGRFAEIENNKPQIWIAGGIGITPFLSLARSLNTKRDIALFYSVKEVREFVFLDELKKISEEDRNFKVIAWESETKGHLEAQSIEKTVGQLKDKQVLLCGPWTMMMSLKKQLVALGVPRKSIRYEEFKLV